MLAAVILNLTFLSAVNVIAFAAVPSGTMSYIPSAPTLAIRTSAKMSLADPAADSTLIPILAAPSDVNGDTI